MPAIAVRDENSEAMSTSSSLRPIYIAGFVVVGVLLLGVALWLAIRTHRRRAQAKREENLGAAFLSVKGLVREGDVHTEKAPLPESVFGSFSFVEIVLMYSRLETSKPSKALLSLASSSLVL